MLSQGNPPLRSQSVALYGASHRPPLGVRRQSATIFAIVFTIFSNGAETALIKTMALYARFVRVPPPLHFALNCGVNLSRPKPPPTRQYCVFTKTGTPPCARICLLPSPFSVSFMFSTLWWRGVSRSLCSALRLAAAVALGGYVLRVFRSRVPLPRPSMGSRQLGGNPPRPPAF